LSNLPAGTSPKQLSATIKARWCCDRAHERLEEELGLDHLEDEECYWTGLHRPAPATTRAHDRTRLRALAVAPFGPGRTERSTFRPAALAQPVIR
jgi:SRSO17 transposase